MLQKNITNEQNVYFGYGYSDAVKNNGKYFIDGYSQFFINKSLSEVEIDEAIEEDQVCPEGFCWDAEQNKCVPCPEPTAEN